MGLHGGKVIEHKADTVVELTNVFDSQGHPVKIKITLAEVRETGRGRHVRMRYVAPKTVKIDCTWEGRDSE